MTPECTSRATPDVRIVHLDGPTFQALADGDLTAANATSPVPLPPYFAGPDWRSVWRERRRLRDREDGLARLRD